MGASTWNYFVPYDPDVRRALARLRESVFEKEQYGDGLPTADSVRQMFYRMAPQMPDLEDARKRLSDSIAAIEDLRAQLPKWPKASSIEELLIQRGENGTHSILDIQGVAGSPEPGAISEMPAEEILRVFGTSRPTRAQVESKLYDEDLLGHPLVADRWQGVFFKVFGDDESVEWFFIGTSGD